MIEIRPALQSDAPAMCALINPIIAEGSTTGHRGLFTPDRMEHHYISPPLGVSCLIAIDGNGLAGFQALEMSDPDWPGPDRLPSGWAIIASFVAAGRQGQGIGRLLWSDTLVAARAVGVVTIDATIRDTNQSGLAYYSSIGFQDYRRTDWPLSDGTPAPRTCKRYEL